MAAEPMLNDANLEALCNVLGDTGTGLTGSEIGRYLRDCSKRGNDPRFKELGERLEALKARHEQGLLTSVEFLKELLKLARDVVSTERTAPPLDREAEGKAALTELFEEAKHKDTPIIVERVVNDIDEIVRVVRFPGWQATHAGEREVKLALQQSPIRYRE